MHVHIKCLKVCNFTVLLERWSFQEPLFIRSHYSSCRSGHLFWRLFLFCRLKHSVRKYFTKHYLTLVYTLTLGTTHYCYEICGHVYHWLFRQLKHYGFILRWWKLNFKMAVHKPMGDVSLVATWLWPLQHQPSQITICLMRLNKVWHPLPLTLNKSNTK